MEKIVIGVSDDASMKAVDWVIERARSRRLEVTLVAAYDWAGTTFSEIAGLLGTVRARIAEKSPRTVVHLIESESSPSQALAAATEHADLLVLGSRHRDHLQALLGVPALRLARRERGTTVIVPEGWRPASSGKVVVGLDEGSSSAALEFAAREAAALAGRLEVVHAWTAPLPAFDPLVWIVDTEEQLRVSHRQHLDAALDALRAEHPEARISGCLEEGLPVAALRARGADADLVVVGSHRTGAIARALLGSTARELLRDSTTPICIVPIPAAAPTSTPGAPGPMAAATP